MSSVIRVDTAVWEWLKTQARPLEDTPNSVLRRVAGIDPPLVAQAADDGTPALAAPPRRKRVTGEWLNRAFRLGAEHSLYHRDGTLFERLERFPGVLCDRHGYVWYDTERDFLNDTRLSIGEKVNVPDSIRAHPSYRTFKSARRRS